MATIMRGALVGIISLALTVISAHGATLASKRVASGLERPVYVTSHPDDARKLYVCEQRTGQIQIVRNGKTNTTPFLDIGSKINGDGQEQGLLCIAFHPNFNENRFVYVTYTVADDDMILERYTATTASADIANPDSAKQIMRIDKPADTHNGGMIAFGPNDGYLYLSVGDGGITIVGDLPAANAQDLSNPLGTILRVDVDGGEPFAIPPDNPFVGVPDADDRIWVYGLRNPWRISFDRATGDLYIGDVGDLRWEEVSFLPASTMGGENFGWHIAEGLECRGGGGTCGTNAGFTPPIHVFEHPTVPGTQFPLSRAVTGGYVYRGENVPQLQGKYIFGEFITTQIFMLDHDNGTDVEVEEITEALEPLGDITVNRIPSFGEDKDGELYFCSLLTGEVYQIATLTQLADVNLNGESNAVDVQTVINGALGMPTGLADPDVVIDGVVNAQDVQTVINGVLGL